MPHSHGILSFLSCLLDIVTDGYYKCFHDSHLLVDIAKCLSFITYSQHDTLAFPFLTLALSRHFKISKRLSSFRMLPFLYDSPFRFASLFDSLEFSKMLLAMLEIQHYFLLNFAFRIDEWIITMILSARLHRWLPISLGRIFSYFLFRAVNFISQHHFDVLDVFALLFSADDILMEIFHRCKNTYFISWFLFIHIDVNFIIGLPRFLLIFAFWLFHFARYAFLVIT